MVAGEGHGTAQDGGRDPHRRQRVPLRGVGAWLSASSSRWGARTWAASAAPTVSARASAAVLRGGRRHGRGARAGRLGDRRRGLRGRRDAGEAAVQCRASCARPTGASTTSRSRTSRGAAWARRSPRPGPRQRGQPGPRGRQPGLPDAGRRARADHTRPLAGRELERSGQITRRRLSITRSAPSSPARSGPSRTWRSTPTR